MAQMASDKSYAAEFARKRNEIDRYRSVLKSGRMNGRPLTSAQRKALEHTVETLESLVPRLRRIQERDRAGEYSRALEAQRYVTEKAERAGRLAAPAVIGTVTGGSSLAGMALATGAAETGLSYAHDGRSLADSIDAGTTDAALTYVGGKVLEKGIPLVAKGARGAYDYLRSGGLRTMRPGHIVLGEPSGGVVQVNNPLPDGVGPAKVKPGMTRLPWETSSRAMVPSSLDDVLAIESRRAPVRDLPDMFRIPHDPATVWQGYPEYAKAMNDLTARMKSGAGLSDKKFLMMEPGDSFTPLTASDTATLIGANSNRIKNGPFGLDYARVAVSPTSLMATGDVRMSFAKHAMDQKLAFPASSYFLATEEASIPGYGVVRPFVRVSDHVNGLLADGRALSGAASSDIQAATASPFVPYVVPTKSVPMELDMRGIVGPRLTREGAQSGYPYYGYPARYRIPGTNTQSTDLYGGVLLKPSTPDLKGAHLDAKGGETRKADKGGYARKRLLDHVKKWERFETSPYEDVDGNYAIGYGSHFIDGKPVTKDTAAIDEAKASEMLEAYLTEREGALAGAIPNWSTIPSDAQDMLLDVSMGKRGLLSAGSSPNLHRELSAAKTPEEMRAVVRKHYPTYRKAAGKVNDGLVNRRADGLKALGVQADEAGGDAGAPVESAEPTVPQEPADARPSGPRIVINPSTFRNRKDALCVAWNEGIRIFMESSGFEPQSEPTDKQRKFFSDTPYADDEVQLRRTILARIATFDTSVDDPTDDQLSETSQVLRGMIDEGFVKTEDEARKCERLATAVEAAVGAEPARPRSPAEPPAEGPAEPVDGRAVNADYAGGQTDDEQQYRPSALDTALAIKTPVASAQLAVVGKGIESGATAGINLAVDMMENGYTGKDLADATLQTLTDADAMKGVGKQFVGELVDIGKGIADDASIGGWGKFNKARKEMQAMGASATDVAKATADVFTTAEGWKNLGNNTLETLNDGARALTNTADDLTGLLNNLYEEKTGFKANGSGQRVGTDVHGKTLDEYDHGLYAVPKNPNYNPEFSDEVNGVLQDHFATGYQLGVIKEHGAKMGMGVGGLEVNDDFFKAKLRETLGIQEDEDDGGEPPAQASQEPPAQASQEPPAQASQEPPSRPAKGTSHAQDGVDEDGFIIGFNEGDADEPAGAPATPAQEPAADRDDEQSGTAGGPVPVMFGFSTGGGGDGVSITYDDSSFGGQDDPGDGPEPAKPAEEPVRPRVNKYGPKPVTVRRSEAERPVTVRRSEFEKPVVARKRTGNGMWM